MPTQEERIWSRVKAQAADEATNQDPLDADRARMIVDNILWDEHAQSIPREARDFYAQELRSMASDAQ